MKDLFGKFTLLNEVDLSKKIDDHPNVARYEFGLRILHPFPVDFAVMAYYEEGNLDQVLKKARNVLEPAACHEIIGGLLEGIRHLHTENVIHRDLKLANILMSKTKQGHWRPKIADFGLSRTTENSDESVANSAIGITMAYAAPEQIENKPIKKNVDLWAFGVIVYRLMTQEMPFAAPISADVSVANLVISKKILDGEMPDRINEIPEPYRSIVMQCLVKDTSQRAQTADELIQIMRDTLRMNSGDGDPNSNSTRNRAFSDTTTVSDPSVRRSSVAVDGTKRRRGFLSPVLMAVVALALLGGGFFGWQSLGGDKSMVSLSQTSNNIESGDNDKFLSAQKTGAVQDYKNYLSAFPDGKNRVAAADSVKKLEERFNKLMNDTDVFISIEDFPSARAYLQKAAVIEPDNPSVQKKLETLNRK